MTTTHDHSADLLTPVRFSRLARRGIILGLALPQVLTLATALVIFVAALYAGGATALYSSPLWALLAAAAWIPLSGRTMCEWAPVAGHWWFRQLLHQTSFRARPTRPRPAGTLALPGDAAALRQFTDPESGAVMVHDPHAQTLLAVVEVTHRSFVLLDPAEQDRRVHAWGRVLALACRSTRIARVQVLERTLPDSGTGLAQWWADHGDDDGSWVARTYRQLIDRAGPAGERHVTTISLSLNLRAAARPIRAAGGGIRGAAAVLRQDMDSFTTSLRTADLRPGPWYTAGQLAVVLRSAYDPQIAATLERAGTLGQDLATAGPVAVEENWSGLRSDSAVHAVLWISEWPRSLVYPGFLASVLLSNGVHRAFTLLCQPVRSDIAARDIRRAKTEHLADATQRAKLGQIEDASQSAEYQDVLQQEAEIVSGHGVMRFTGLISVSAHTAEDLEAAVAAIEQAALHASCETRRLVGQQAQAFVAAALPLCRGI